MQIRFAITALVSVVASVAALAAPAPANPSAKMEQRMQWHVKTLVVAYQEAGRTNVKWDASVTNAFRRFARMRAYDEEESKEGREAVAADCRKAMSAGCDDPMMRYLNARFVLMDRLLANENDRAAIDEMAKAHRQAALDMEPSRYPAYRKFYAYMRAAQTIQDAEGRVGATNDVATFRVKAAKYISDTLQDATTPPPDVAEACAELAETLAFSPQSRDITCSNMESLLFKSWPNEAMSHAFRGRFRLDQAGRAHANVLAEENSDPAWKSFQERLGQAAQAFERAWELDPTDPQIAVDMLRVESGQGQGRKRLETWFERAMTLDPNNYAACLNKLLYLEPKEKGSKDEALAFARACASSKTWGGQVPLVLADVHEHLASYLPDEERPGYWKNSGVWRDIKTAFEKFFRLNPDDTSWRHNYVRYAFQCEQWDELDREISRLSPVNYEFFGGKAEFDRMAAMARNRGKAPKAQ